MPTLVSHPVIPGWRRYSQSCGRYVYSRVVDRKEGWVLGLSLQGRLPEGRSKRAPGLKKDRQSEIPGL